MASLNTLELDRYLNDFGTHTGIITPVGRIDVTILDNLLMISRTIHGRIIGASSTHGGYKVLLHKNDFIKLINTYAQLTGYKISLGIDLLISTLKNILEHYNNESEVPIDSKVVTQILSVNTEIIESISKSWLSVAVLRLISNSGSNRDIIINGNKSILLESLKKVKSTELPDVLKEIEKVGQLAGIRTIRQCEARDLIGDMLFNRRSDSISLVDVFYQMNMQRKVLYEFRTDILFTPIGLLSQLQKGMLINPLFESNYYDDPNAKEIDIKIKPINFDRCYFTVQNLSAKTVKVTWQGIKTGTSVTTIYPYSQISRDATSIKIDKEDINSLHVSGKVDIRKTKIGGDSIIKRVLKGELSNDSELESWYLQICKPVLDYIPDVIRKLKTSELLQTVFPSLKDEFKEIIEELEDHSLIDRLFSTKKEDEIKRIIYVYTLCILVPQLLLDPTLTFTQYTMNNAPYLMDYGDLISKFRTVFK